MSSRKEYIKDKIEEMQKIFDYWTNQHCIADVAALLVIAFYVGELNDTLAEIHESS